MKDVFFEKGKENARSLRAAAKEMNGTEIIDRERDAPQFEPDRDYSGFPVGSPVRDGGQVWLLLQPHHAAHFHGRPETLRALWGVAHTTDPQKAKAWEPTEEHPSVGNSTVFSAVKLRKASLPTMMRWLEVNRIRVI